MQVAARTYSLVLHSVLLRCEPLKDPRQICVRAQSYRMAATAGLLVCGE